MAFSKSVMKAQDIISCNLCESETKLKWKCLDCDLLMCNKCNDKIHPKFKNAIEHTLVDIKEVGLDDGKRILNFTNIKCKSHTTQSCCLFCSNCDDLVCPICIPKIHAGHTFIEIKEAYDMKLEKLKTIKVKMESSEKGLADDERELNKLKISENLKGEKVLQHIEAQKEAVIKYADQLSKEVQHKMKVTENSISNEQTKAIDSRQKRQEKFNELDDLINSYDPFKVFENIDKVEKYLEIAIKPIYLSHSYIPQFIPGRITPSTVGSLTQMKVNKQFITKIRYCQFIAVCSNSSLWIGSDSDRSLMKITPDGDNLITMATIKTGIRDIAFTPDGDILLANSTSRLTLINGNNEKVNDSKYGVDLLLIMSLHVTSDHKIIVGAMSPGEVIPVAGRRVVIVMDKDGNHESVYEHDGNKQRLLTYPRSITSTSNGTIFVADYTQAYKINSKILALGKDGTILNTYSGHQDINNENQPFEPVSVRSTPIGNIIIPDRYLNVFHILDSSCNLISYFQTREIGIVKPYCVAFTGTTLYIGCSEAKTATNAKLYEIEYSGF
ncbi:uncharacterized protein LOC127709291 [Mytilus californianus]|uniref:uncharacterized protein LOC127709291 n=1 Tax=Mytilus californianus TaxID=6549 RepID=UPI0022486DF0|nr:uncharacterized protein LOC127709291 [Mytilus californianus]